MTTRSMGFVVQVRRPEAKKKKKTNGNVWHFHSLGYISEEYNYIIISEEWEKIYTNY